MRVRFWGTRGSIATPGPATNHFGGNTSCVQVSTLDGELLVFDLGTGARLLGAALMASDTRPLKGSIVLTHTHWDHIQGFPFFAPLFVPGSLFTVHGPRGGSDSLERVLAGQMEFPYFPVELSQLPAAITYHELAEGPYQIGPVRVEAQFLNHPAVTLGYRVEADGAVLAYITDHEPFSESLWRAAASPGRLESMLHEGDRRHARFLSGADLVIHDAQYTPEEYRQKKNWGHSTYQYVVEIAVAAGVRRLALTHHDPNHDDRFLDELEQSARDMARAVGSNLEVFCAYEGCELALVAGRPRSARVATAEARASALGPSHVLVADDDPDIRFLVRRALSRGGHTVTEAADGEEALRLLREQLPDLLILDLMMPPPDGLAVLAGLRSEPATAALRVLVLTARDDEQATRTAFDLGAVDYLTKPFTMQQLAARVRACLERTASP